MIFVKLNDSFLSADEISKTCNLSIDEINECVDKGLLLSFGVVRKYFPEHSQSVKKILTMFALENYDLDNQSKTDLINKAGNAEIRDPEKFIKSALSIAS